MRLRSTDQLQNLKSKNKEIFKKTKTDKYKNNEINRLEFIKNDCYTFSPQRYIQLIKIKKMDEFKNILFLLLFILYFIIVFSSLIIYIIYTRSVDNRHDKNMSELTKEN